MAISGEEWRPLVGLEGSYEVSSLGRVRSLPRERTAGGVLKAWVNKNGYLYVKVGSTAANRRGVTVHSLVAEAFLEPRPPGMQVRHIDHDRTNPRADNLRWGTHQDNVDDMIEAGRHYNTRKTHCKSGHEFTPENTRIRKDGNRDCRTCDIERSAARRARLKPRL